MKWLWTVAVVALLAGATAPRAHEFKIKDLEFIHPWTREPAQGVKDVLVYMVLKNTGSTPERIVVVSSPFAACAELREGKADGGRKIETILIPQNATTELSPDGRHILLRGLTEPLDGYQYFPLVLTFERAGNVEIEVYVEESN